MYNDYYLQEINENIETIQEQLQSITNNQASLIENTNTLISGDNEQLNELEIINYNINTGFIWTLITMWAILLFLFLDAMFNRKG